MNGDFSPPLASNIFSSLSLPIIAAPMFLVSTRESVVSACRSGIIGSCPALNLRSSEDLERFLTDVEKGIALGPVAGIERCGPHSINLVTHRTNPRLQSDLEVVIRKKIPVVITSLGADKGIVERIHEYGGIVLHDVVSVRHAKLALEAGVDGIIAVTHGAGGHAGTLHPFPFLHELRALTEKPIILAGAVSTGQQVAAAIVAGASMVSVGTRFIAVSESGVSPEYRQMIVDSSSSEITYTPRLSGVNANFMTKSIEAAGVDLSALKVPDGVSFGGEGKELAKADTGDAKVYVDIWSAGQGVGSIDSVASVYDVVAEMRSDFKAAIAKIAGRYL